MQRKKEGRKIKEQEDRSESEELDRGGEKGKVGKKAISKKKWKILQ